MNERIIQLLSAVALQEAKIQGLQMWSRDRAAFVEGSRPLVRYDLNASLSHVHFAFSKPY